MVIVAEQHRVDVSEFRHVDGRGLRLAERLRGRRILRSRGVQRWVGQEPQPYKLDDCGRAAD